MEEVNFGDAGRSVRMSSAAQCGVIGRIVPVVSKFDTTRAASGRFESCDKQDAITIQHIDPTNVIHAMRYLLASTLAAVIVATSTAAMAQTSGASGTSIQQCAIGYVTGVGGSPQSVREYFATPDRDQYRYLRDNPIQCRISDEGRASACTGVTSLQHDKVSVYDDVDSTTMAVVARVELDRGTYPVIIVVRKQDVQCEQ
jgi:hypothetical protein